MTEEERRARLEQALHYGGDTHALGDVAQALKYGVAQWWQHEDGMIVTEVQNYPRVKAIHYWLIAGRLSDCQVLQPRIDAWAIEQGCHVATAMGRPGWLRAGGEGWRVVGHSFAKDLRNGR